MPTAGDRYTMPAGLGEYLLLRVRHLTGQSFVPVLVLDNGEAISGSGGIVAWADRNPAVSPAGSLPLPQCGAD